MSEDQNLFLIYAGFILVIIAAKQIGLLCTKIKLPLITGFLATGIIAGPFFLNSISEETIQNLGFMYKISLAIIALAAGGELYLKKLKRRLKSVRWVTIGLVISTFTLGSFTVLLLSDFIPFMKDMPLFGKIAISILSGSILVARSPSSAIAIVKELRAKGPFTQTAIGVTVIMDVVVIILFSINSSVADALLTESKFAITSVVLLFGELGLSILLGHFAGKILLFFTSCKTNDAIKSVGILLTGYSVFLLSANIRSFTHLNFSHEILLEPLLICMIGGFIAGNNDQYRDEFLRIMHKIEPTIYIVFFTLTGASLNMNILATIWPITLILFFLRIGAIFIGSFTGGQIAGDPGLHKKLSWMAYITQAGIGIGLATEVAVQFPDWGNAFATMMISVIVVNQIIGPVLFKWVIYLVGEAHPKAKKTESGIIHKAIIFGFDAQAITLAKQLQSHNWQVTVATFDSEKLKKISENEVKIKSISDISLSELRLLGVAGSGAIITMLSDEKNHSICEITSEHFSATNMIVQLNNRINYDKFNQLGALIVAPSTAMISLLDHFVRSPSTVTLLLGMDENMDIIDLRVKNPNLLNLQIQNLRLPEDSMIISIHRSGRLLNIHDHTHLKKNDLITVTGPWKSLEHLPDLFDDL